MARYWLELCEQYEDQANPVLYYPIGVIIRSYEANDVHSVKVRVLRSRKAVVSGITPAGIRVTVTVDGTKRFPPEYRYSKHWNRALLTNYGRYYSSEDLRE